VNILKIIWTIFQSSIEKKTKLFIWLIFTIIAGQLGIFINLIIAWCNHIGWGNSIYYDSINGNFYIFSFALIASAIGLVYGNLDDEDKPGFKNIKIIVTILASFVVIFCCVLYTIVVMNRNKDLIIIKNTELQADWAQIIFYICAIAFSIFCFLLVKLDPNDERYSWLCKENEHIKETEDKSKKATSTDEGVSI
jgi:hypothetical protein